MTKSVSKNKKADLPQFIKDELYRHELSDIKAGDKIIDKDGYIHEVENIYTEERNDWSDENGERLKKPKKYDEVQIAVGYWQTDEESGKKEFYRYGSFTMEEFKRKYIKLHKPADQLKQEAIESLTKSEVVDEESQSISSETALVHAGSKEHLVALKDSLQQKRDMMEVKIRMLNRVLRQKKDELDIILKDFEKKVETIRKVIYTIELYLGINEEVMLLQDGDRAPATDPICFRQEILFMDEEVGDPEHDGIDFKRIDDFDNWLIKNKNYKRIMPETKGVVVIRVRRKDKEYHNPFLNFIWNEQNRMTYILIRNGDRICRIWADIQIHPRLFPKRNEMQEYMDKIEGKKEEVRYIGMSAKEQAERRVFRYKQQMIMLQGMIDRTELFHPLPAPDIKIGSQESMDKNYIRFIYDDELKLPSNRMFFRDWQKMVNAGIKEGSRIILSSRFGRSGYDSKKEYEDRYVARTSTYKLPPSGVYLVEKLTRVENTFVQEWMNEEEFKKMKGYSSDAWEHAWENDYEWVHGKDYENKKLLVNKKDKDGSSLREDRPVDRLVIKYNPKDTLYGGWGEYDPHERKNRISFIIEPDDEFLLNFDEVSMDDVEFYLDNRLDRRTYLWMMPCLYAIKKHRIAEIEFEKNFVKMMVGQLYKQAQKVKVSSNDLEKLIWNSISWWKLKNKWKRGIDKDDAKALRMIKSRIEKQLTALSSKGDN